MNPFDHDFPFGSMNNLDQNPMNCQSSSRISPARSTSSIDQFTHHHGKGDSAYSSFSGGSNAPDYSSPCLPEEMHSHSLQYVDHKYVRAVFNPNVLNPDPKGMDHLYKSMETFNMQCHQDFNTQSATNQGYKEPPQPPARMDSFITIRNLENTKLCQGPEGQLQQRTRTVSSPDIVYCKPDSGSARRVSQANQILPVKDYVRCKGADQASSQKLEMKKFTNILSRSPPSFILQECLKNNTGSAASSSEKQQRSPLSAQAFEQTGSQSRNSTQATQNMVNGNIQHKGQYYFVTGVCKPSEPSRKDSLSGVNARESKGRSKEDHGHLKNKEVSFNFRNDLPNQSRHKRQSSYEIPGVHGLKVYNESQSMQAWNGDQGYSNESAHSSSQTSPPRISKVPRSHSSEVPEPNPKAQSREIGYEFRRHHSSSHHIFYCGPEESDPPKQKEPVTSKDGSSSRCVGFISNNGDRGKRQPLGDVANDKINKEMTPMLYHLTGESGGAFMYKTRNENEPGNWKLARQSSGPFSKHKEASVVEPAHPISRSFCLSEGAEDENQDQGDTLCSSGSSVDDSYNKYYKEKLKDAQTKVLRETSFKRKDLQLSWPHRIKQKPSARPSVIHSRASSLSSATDIGNDNPVHAGPAAKGKKEEKKLQDSQPQPARIGARKRLKPEQKKLCYSEPERLNQLEDLHGQSGHRPAGNEEEPSQEDFNEQGTVASRRKVFEKRGRTLSVSSISKNELKQIQHNAVVEYMERKSGQKPASPQQVPSQNPQRLSTPGRLADWGVTSSTGSGTQKLKRPRPLSAGRVLDSSSSSIRYAHSPGFQSIGSHNQPNRRQSATQAPGKSASMESLLDQPERIGWRARSKSSSSPVQIDKNTPDTSPLLDSTSYSHQQKNGGDIVKKPVDTSREEHQVRTVSERRGKSMEELGISAVSGPAVLSKSSEQLDQIRSGEMPRQPRKSLGWEQKNQSSRAKVPETTRKSESEVPPFKKDLIEPRSKEEPEPVKASSAFERHPNALKTLGFQGVPCKTPSLPQGSSPLGPSVSGSPHYGPSCKAPMADSVFFNDHPSPQSLDCMELFEIEPGLANTGPSSTELLRTRSEKGPDESEPRGRLRTTHPVQCLESDSVGDPHQDSLYWDSTQASSPASDSGVRTESSTSSPAKHAESAATEGRSEGAKPPLNSSTNAKDSVTQLPVPPTGEMSSVVPSTAPAGEPVQDNSITNKAKLENQMEDKTGPHNPSLTKPPSKSAVEQKWEELATAIVAKDLSLAEVLVPESNRKTTLKLMEQLLSDDTLLTEEYYKRKEARRQSKESDENPETNSDSIPLDTPGTELLANTSEEQKTTQDAQGDPSDVTEKKKALIVNIKWKLQCLEEQKEELGADLQRNSVLGVSVETAVRNSCRPNEYERYTLFIGDLEKVVNLLLCLSSRLARVENALSQVNQATDPEDKQSLNERHRLLCRQHEDAKDLKENLLRRERVVSEILLKHLSQQQLQDYKHFVKVKASLLIEQRDLDERVRVSEEQLESLQNSIPPK